MKRKILENVRMIFKSAARLVVGIILADNVNKDKEKIFVLTFRQYGYESSVIKVTKAIL